MADIFVSYSSNDRARARRLATFLQDNGHTVWWDRELIIGGDFEQEIDQQLNKASVVIVCWSERSIGSHWVKSEANEGMRSNRLVPVTLDKTPAPRPFDQLTTLDLSNWSDEAGKRLLAAIGEVPDSPSMSAFQKARQRTRIIASSVAASLALVIVGLWGPVTSLFTLQPANAVSVYEKPRISEAAARHILRRLNDTGRPTSDANIALMQTGGDVHDAIRLLETKRRELLETKHEELAPDIAQEEEAALLHQTGALSFDYDPAKAHAIYRGLVQLAPDDTLALERFARLLIDRGELEAAKTYLQTAYELTDELSEDRLLIEIRMAQLAISDDKNHEVLQKFYHIAEKAEELDHPAAHAKALRHLATMYAFGGAPDFEAGEKHLINALKIQKSMPAEEEELAASYIIAGILDRETNNETSAIDNFSQALRISKSIGHPSGISIATDHLAGLMVKQKKFDEADKLYREQLIFSTEHRIQYLQQAALQGLAVLAHTRGDPVSTTCNYISEARNIDTDAPIRAHIKELNKDIGCDEASVP